MDCGDNVYLDENQVEARAIRSLYAALAQNPTWRLSPHHHAERQDVIKAIALSHDAVNAGYTGLINSTETDLLTAVLANMHPGSLVVNEPSDWSRYKGENVVIWNKFIPDPGMLSVRDIKLLTGRTDLIRSIVFKINELDLFTIRLARDSALLLVSENTIGEIVESYDRHFLRHDNLLEIVEHIQGIARLSPILEPEMNIAEEEQEGEQALAEMEN